MTIYVKHGGTTYGPYTEIQVREYLKQGVFAAEDVARRERASEWQPISAIVHPEPPKPAVVPRLTANAKPLRRLSTSLVVFLAAFFGVILAGGVLMLVWQYFLRDRAPGPFAVSSSIKPTTVESLFQRKGELSGEVFIVTRGGQNYKLGLVSVALYPIHDLEPYIDEKKRRAQMELARLKPLIETAKSDRDQKDRAWDNARKAYFDHLGYGDPERASLQAVYDRAGSDYSSAQEAYSALSADRHKVLSGSFYFADLPQPTVLTQTNSDGRFKIEMPTKGGFALAASAHRSVGDSEEHYYWLLRVSLDGASTKTIMLSNNNMSSEGSPDSLIRTED